MIKLKLCGIRRDEDIEILNRLSKEKLCPDWIGFVLAQGYRRTISPEQAAELYAKLESKNSVKERKQWKFIWIIPLRPCVIRK